MISSRIIEVSGCQIVQSVLGSFFTYLDSSNNFNSIAVVFMFNDVDYVNILTQSPHLTLTLIIRGWVIILSISCCCKSTSVGVALRQVQLSTRPHYFLRRSAGTHLLQDMVATCSRPAYLLLVGTSSIVCTAFFVSYSSESFPSGENSNTKKISKLHGA
jgi:hypothetical protein